MKLLAELRMLLMLWVFFATITLATAQQFIRGSVYSDGLPSLSATAGDFNGDGTTDLAFLGSTATGSSISIRLGTGDGKFTAGRTVTLGYGNAVISGDWNNDGTLDLAVSSLANGSVYILIGKGDGSFAVQAQYKAGQFPQSLAAGDLNGDGLADLVIAHYENVSVLLGLGDGRFAAPVFWKTGFYEMTWGVATGDFNRDGKLDVAAVCDDAYDGLSKLSILLGRGDGTFAPPGIYDLTFGAERDPVVTDLNNDGIPDIAAAGDFLSVFIGRGDGTFRSQVTYQGPFFSGSVVAAGDFNHDGNSDLVSLSFVYNDMAVYLGNGDGTLQPPSLLGTGPYPISLAVSDFNQDGNLDLAVADGADDNFVEFAGDGSGSFSASRVFFAGGNSVAAGYLDGDQNLDLASVDGFHLNLLSGDGNGAFRQGATYIAKEATWVAVADLNGDGKNDVVLANGKNQTVTVRYGNGDGTLQVPANYPTGGDSEFVAAVDVNGDGKPDLLTANELGSSISVLLASGSGYLLHADYAVSRPLRLAFADFNGDGKVDLVTANSKGSSTVFLNNGDGSFVAGVTLITDGSPPAVATGDVNHDGYIDVMLAPSQAGIVYSFLGNGDGTFRAGVTSVAPGKTSQIALGDFDADGNLDMALAQGVGVTGYIRLLRGKGDGSFSQPQIYSVDNEPAAEVIGDFNRDGALDLITANTDASTISVLLNRGSK